MVYLFSSLPGLICHWFNQSSAPINSSEKPPSDTPSFSPGGYFFFFPFFLQVFAPFGNFKKQSSPVFAFHEHQKQFILGECRPWPLGNHWWPILGPNWGFTGSSFILSFLLEDCYSPLRVASGWLNHSFIHSLVHSLNSSNMYLSNFHPAICQALI